MHSFIKKLRWSAFAFGVAVCLLTATPAIAAGPYYVDPVAGNNADDGLSQANAWLTIPYAEENAANGSIVYVLAGNYGDVTINRATTARHGVTPSSWADAVTFTPYAGADAVIATFTVWQDRDRYIVFDTVTFHSTSVAVVNESVVNIPNSNYVKFTGCDVSGVMTKHTDGEYYRDTTTDHAFVCGQAAGIGYSHIIIEDCNIHHVGIFGIKLGANNNGSNQILDNVIHHIGASHINPTIMESATTGDLIEGNFIHSQMAVSSYNAGGGVSYNHGSGNHLASHLTIRKNVFWGVGTSAAIRGYQDAMDGAVKITGTWDDTAHIFSVGEYVTQATSGAKGQVDDRWIPAIGSTIGYIARATSGTVFDDTHDIVADADPLKIWRPSAVEPSGDWERWGGYHHVVIEDNYVQGANYMVPELHDLGPPFRLVNNTFPGYYYAAENANHLGQALWWMAPYYSGDIADVVICSNIFAGNVAQGFPAGATVVGNLMWRYMSTVNDATLNASFPGNKVYGWTQDLDAIEEFTTAGNMFGGGTNFANAFNTPSFYNADKTILVTGWTYADLAHQFDAHAGSDAKGYADLANYTATDFWGNARDADPDSGYAEHYTAPPLPPTGDRPIMLRR